LLQNLIAEKNMPLNT